MRQWFRRLRIAHKLTALSLINVTFALGVAGTVAGVVDTFEFRSSFLQNLASQIQIVGHNALGAIAFGDPQSAQDVLKSFAANPTIVCAQLRTDEPEPLAAFERHEGCTEYAEQKYREYFPSHKWVIEEVFADGEEVANIHALVSLEAVYGRLYRWALLLVVIVLAVGSLSLLLSPRLNALITQPIMDLAELAEVVAKNQNYSLRAESQNDDEIGSLSHSINEMLSVTEHANAALVEAREQADANHLALRSIIGAMPGALVVTNNAHIELVNDSMKALSGFTESDIHGATIDRVFPQIDSVQDSTSESLQTYETVFVTKDDEEIPVSLVMSTALLSRQGIGRTIYIAIDIRERKAAEAKLKETHRQLVQASRQAGMAEIATGVLHNVGNVLNSVNVSGQMVRDTIQQSKVGSLQKLSDLLNEHQNQLVTFFSAGQKGEKIPTFLSGLAARFVQEQEQLLNEMNGLLKHIDHIKTIVSSQQSFAKQGGALELLTLEEIIDAAVDMYGSAFHQSGVCVLRQYADCPKVSVDRHKVMQILINFLSNAQQSIVEYNGERREIRIETGFDDAKIWVHVVDSGKGISKENLAKVFVHGFTTKKTGHGFGLHSSANAASEMGGRIYCQSDGVGHGATFIFEIPYAKEQPLGRAA